MPDQSKLAVLGRSKIPDFGGSFVKEMLTIWYALLMVSQENITIQILCDNSSALQVLKKGGSRTYHLYSLAELILKRVTAFNWTLKISHIAGTFNVLADQLSRDTPLSTEWTLTTQDFQKILKINPNLQVDLFATRLNNKLETFVSPCPDPTAVAVNALATPWDEWDHLYMFPPRGGSSSQLKTVWRLVRGGL